MENEILKRASANFARENVLPRMTFRLVGELAADGISVAVACRVLNVSRSCYYGWSTRPPSARSLADTELTATILAVHQMSRSTRCRGAPTGRRGSTPSCGWASG
nr:hypothetical protein [Cellulomonas shaoxiangyii]